MKKKLTSISCLFLGFVLGISSTKVDVVPKNPLSDYFLSKIPQSQFSLQKEEFFVQYDGRLKQPSFVYEIVQRDQLTGDFSRKQVSFSQDNSLPGLLCSKNSDYKNSGYDRGHLSPACIHKRTKSAMKESFLLSNISPQDPKFNRGYWKKLENRVQEVAEKHGKVYVVTGPLFLSQKDTNGKSFVRYEVIGESQIAVPTHYFKLIKTQKFIEAFVVPNRNISETISINNFSVEKEYLIKISGVDFSNILN